MKYMKRSGVYKASNVTFNPESLSAYSYGWWKFVGMVEGKVIFNNYRYSNSTSKHQYKVRSLLEALGIKIDITMPIPAGLPGTYGRMGSVATNTTLQELIEMSETHLCDEFLIEQIKRQDRYQRAKERKLQKQAEERMRSAATSHERPRLSLVSGGLQ